MCEHNSHGEEAFMLSRKEVIVGISPHFVGVTGQVASLVCLLGIGWSLECTWQSRTHDSDTLEVGFVLCQG